MSIQKLPSDGSIGEAGLTDDISLVIRHPYDMANHESEIETMVVPFREGRRKKRERK